MAMIRSFFIDSSYNRVSGTMTIPEAGKRPFPCVVLSHGLISSKTSSKYVTLSDRLDAEGIASCRFDYHGCGESGGAIEDTTLTIRLENLEKIVEYARSQQEIDPERIGLLGGSFGGVTSVVKASLDRRIKCISPWATPYELPKPEDGSIEEIRFKDTLYSDFAQYDILSQAEKVSHALVVHGDADEIVPYREGIAIYDHLRQPKKLEIISGADHVFSAPTHRERAISLAIEWFKGFLDV
jgi:uncharacterized protein